MLRKLGCVEIWLHRVTLAQSMDEKNIDIIIIEATGKGISPMHTHSN